MGRRGAYLEAGGQLGLVEGPLLLHLRELARHAVVGIHRLALVAGEGRLPRLYLRRVDAFFGLALLVVAGRLSGDPGAMAELNFIPETGPLAQANVALPWPWHRVFEMPPRIAGIFASVPLDRGTSGNYCFFDMTSWLVLIQRNPT
jgi:hypothetical protein